MIIVRDEFLQEAAEYAKASCQYTSNRHDFHDGGLNRKAEKMFEGKVGEKIFKEFLILNRIHFIEDDSPANEADMYDFLINNLTIDVKTRTKAFHTRTLEMVEQMKKNPKNIYISVKLSPNKKSGDILGWATSNDFIEQNQIQNNGFLDNYVLYDHQLRDINTFIPFITNI